MDNNRTQKEESNMQELAIDLNWRYQELPDKPSQSHHHLKIAHPNKNLSAYQDTILCLEQVAAYLYIRSAKFQKKEYKGCPFSKKWLPNPIQNRETMILKTNKIMFKIRKDYDLKGLNWHNLEKQKVFIFYY